MSAPTVGEPGVVAVDACVELDVLELVDDELLDEEDVLLDDGVPDGVVLGWPDAVDEQLGVAGPVDPPLEWPAGVVPPLLPVLVKDWWWLVAEVLCFGVGLDVWNLFALTDG
jgi:hypothetical protein